MDWRPLPTTHKGKVHRRPRRLMRYIVPRWWMAEIGGTFYEQFMVCHEGAHDFNALTERVILAVPLDKARRPMGRFTEGLPMPRRCLGDVTE